MKNLSTSIVAFLSIVPFTAAFADPGTQLGQEPTSNLPVEIVTIGDASRNAAAAASFVEGAYNVLGEAINELDQNIKDAKTSADSTYQAKTDSTVAANGNYIQAGTGVATNLGALDTQVKTNTDAIATNTTSITTLNGDSTVVGSVDNKISTATTTINTSLATKQNASDSTVATDGNYIQAGTGVATNLGALDTQVKTNTDAIAENTTNIATLENKVVTIFTDWADRSKTAEIALNDPTPAKQ